MILFTFKLCVTSLIIMVIALSLDKLLESESDYEWEQDELTKKVRKVIDYVILYSFIAGVALGLIWVLMIVWFI